jgi:hypothetical protein
MGALRRILAALIALRGVTNFGKPFGAGTGLVVFGRLMHGMWSTVVAPLLGVAILVYAWALWQARPSALPLGVVYAIWSTVNVLLFPVFEVMPPSVTPGRYAVFAVAGIVGPWLAVWLATKSPQA